MSILLVRKNHDRKFNEVTPKPSSKSTLTKFMYQAHSFVYHAMGSKRELRYLYNAFLHWIPNLCYYHLQII